MKIRDKKLRKTVDVCDADCAGRTCYWPRQNPGSFVQGRGYRSYGDERDNQYLCGTRNAHGCPDKPKYKQEFLRPKLKRDWEGLKVRSIRAMRNGQAELPAGTVFTIERNYGGLHLKSAPCETCGISIYIRIPESYVEIIG
ncbi:MAG: hypothetical protein ACE5GM_11695 [bacterium]